MTTADRIGMVQVEQVEPPLIEPKGAPMASTDGRECIDGFNLRFVEPCPHEDSLHGAHCGPAEPPATSFLRGRVGSVH
jgi:hypothetical protein